MSERNSGANVRLAVYGTLAPGRHNYHQIAGIKGRWTQGTLRGHLVPSMPFGPAVECPGLVLDPDGARVPVHVLQSPMLPDHWERLDAFEGPGYLRVIATVETAAGPLEASVYALDPAFYVLDDTGSLREPGR